jgi:hypothetical protein
MTERELIEVNASDPEICECRTCKACDGDGRWITHDLVDGVSVKWTCNSCCGTGLDSFDCRIHHMDAPQNASV